VIKCCTPAAATPDKTHSTPIYIEKGGREKFSVSLNGKTMSRLSDLVGSEIPIPWYNKHYSE
jgi:hypothetical protein